jgi:hypothetical protein
MGAGIIDDFLSFQNAFAPKKVIARVPAISINPIYRGNFDFLESLLFPG